MWVTIHDCPIPYTEAQSPNMCSWTHNIYDLLSVTMHDCLLLFIICAKSLPNHTLPQHSNYNIYTIHTYEPPERLPPESQIYSSIGGRPVHRWPRNGKMDIQCLKTERIAHGYMECYNEWTDISRWTHSHMASVPFWLWTMDSILILCITVSETQLLC